MKKNSSTMDLSLSSNERLYLKKNNKSLFKFPLIRNFSSENVKFYPFHVDFKKKKDGLLIVLINIRYLS